MIKTNIPFIFNYQLNVTIR